jgi:hypothetical protein
LFTKLRNGTVQRNVSELFIHVVPAGSGLHTDDDAVGFDISGVFLVDLKKIVFPAKDQ